MPSLLLRTFRPVKWQLMPQIPQMCPPSRLCQTLPEKAELPSTREYPWGSFLRKLPSRKLTMSHLVTAPSWVTHLSSLSTQVALCCPSAGPDPNPFHCEQTPIYVLCRSPPGPVPYIPLPVLLPEPGCPWGKKPFSSGSAPGSLLTSGTVFFQELS